MFVKKICFVLVMVFLFVSVFAVSTSAARTGEFETGFVEFKALTPDDFFEPIEIVLTHKTEQYELKYYLYKINKYFSNEPVPVGDFEVTVNVANDEEEYGFVYDDRLFVESINLAVPFRIIVDSASLEGGLSDEEIANVEDEEEEKFLQDIENFFDSEDEEYDGDEAGEVVDGEVNEGFLVDFDVEVENKEVSNENKSGGLLISLLFSVVLIVAGGLVVLWYKNR